MFDRTTKTLLTLIAIALWVQLLSPMFIPVATKAQSTQEKQMIARAKSVRYLSLWMPTPGWFTW